MILLDTSVLSRAFRRRRPGAAEHRLQLTLADLMAGELELGVPGIVLQETLSGIRSSEQFANLERRLLAAFQIILPSVSEHVQAARLRNQCLSAGISASDPDCLIAIMAISGGHELMTLDSDFQRIADHGPLKLFNIGQTL